VVSAFHGPGALGGALPVILFVGGVGVLPGVGMLLGGRALLRRARKRD
jgi:hypothetical protein